VNRATVGDLDQTFALHYCCALQQLDRVFLALVHSCTARAAVTVTRERTLGYRAYQQPVIINRCRTSSTLAIGGPRFDPARRLSARAFRTRRLLNPSTIA
jgi:hypothetical protein